MHVKEKRSKTVLYYLATIEFHESMILFSVMFRRCLYPCEDRIAKKTAEQVP